jgi:hypothetical protein
MRSATNATRRRALNKIALISCDKAPDPLAIVNATWSRALHFAAFVTVSIDKKRGIAHSGALFLSMDRCDVLDRSGGVRPKVSPREIAGAGASLAQEKPWSRLSVP